MGCLGRVGCLMSVVLLAILGWLTRDRWMDFVDDAGSDSAVISTSTEGVWQPLTAQGAERGRRALEVLQQPEGPSAVVLTPSDLGAYVYRELARQLPPSADSVEATTLGDQLHVRASVRLRELGG